MFRFLILHAHTTLSPSSSTKIILQLLPWISFFFHSQPNGNRFPHLLSPFYLPVNSLNSLKFSFPGHYANKSALAKYICDLLPAEFNRQFLKYTVPLAYLRLSLQFSFDLSTHTSISTWSSSSSTYCLVLFKLLSQKFVSPNSTQSCEVRSTTLRSQLPSVNDSQMCMASWVFPASESNILDTPCQFRCSEKQMSKP